MTLRISTMEKEGTYQGSKWLKLHILCDADELALLFQRLHPFSIYPLTGVVSLDQIPLQEEFFLSEYGSWMASLKRGEIPTDAALRKILACAWTAEEDSFWLQSLSPNRYLVKIAKPVIQVQAHFFTYSPIDGVFRPMSMGLESIFWGLQFSFPQVYQDPKTMELLEPKESPNKALFHKIRETVRDLTRATPFVVGGKKVNATIRLGKNCFSWINQHPGLAISQLSVFEGAAAARSPVGIVKGAAL